MIENLIGLFMASPELGVAKVKEYIEQYKPLVYDVCNEVVPICRDYANNKELCKIRATLKKNTFDAYVEAGFSEEQAMATMLNDNLRLMENMKQIKASYSSEK